MIGCVFLSQNWAPLTNGWLRFFVPKIGHHSLKKIYKWLAAFFCPKNWAPLVKKIYKWLAAFFCPKIGHHSLKKDFSHFGWPEKNHCLHLNLKTTKQKFLILFDTRNQQPIFFNEFVVNSPALNLQMVGCVFLSQNWAPLVKKIYKWLAAFFVPKIGHHWLKKFTNGWLRFFVPKLGTTQMVGCVFLSQKLGKNLQMVGCVFLSQNWAPLVKKIYKWLAAFFCPKIGHHSLKKDFSHFGWPRKKSLFAPELENYQTKIFNSVWHQKPTTDFLQWNCYKLTSTEKIYKWLAAFFCPKIGHHSLKKFTNGWLRFFVPKLGTTRWKNLQMVGCVFLSQNWAPLVKKNLQMVGCVFLSQNWAPLVKKIYKWFGCVFLSQNWAPLVKKRFFTFCLAPEKNHCLSPELENYQTKIFNAVWHQKPTTDFHQWICYKLTSTEFTNDWLRFFVPKIGHHWLKKFTNGWLRFFVPKLGTTREKNLQMVGCVFLSQNWAPLVEKIYKWLAAFFCPKNWAPLVEKIHKWLAAFFCPKIGHHSLKKFTNGWLRFFVPKLGTTR